MREQKGYVFHRYGSWFVRFMDDVRQPDGTIERKLVCRKLDVPYGGEYRTKKSVVPFVKELLAPINSGLLNPQSTMLVSEFVEKVYLPEYVEKKLRAATLKQYRDVWNNHIRGRLGKLKLTLREFRCVHGEQMLSQIAEKDGLGRSSRNTAKPFSLAHSSRRSAWGSSTVSTPFKT